MPDGGRIFFPLDDFKLLPIIWEVYVKKIYGIESDRIADFKLVCDVGAHIGLFTLRTARQAPSSKLIAIEPDPINFKFLVRNILTNRLKDRVLVYNMAAGSKREKALLLESMVSRGDSSLKVRHETGVNKRFMVDVIPLDDILLKLEGCDLIKIDAEGSEDEIVKGLEKSIGKIKNLVMEVHIPVVDVNELKKWLQNHGFIITKAQKLYEDTLILKASRFCA